MTSRGLAAVAAVVAFALAGAAVATTTDELGARIEQVRKSGAERARAAWDFASEKKLVASFGSAADLFHELAADGRPLAAEAERLLAAIEAARERYTAVIEAMQAEVIRIDGDLEAAQDSAAWREREELAMRLLYRINWVRYEIATRYETDTSKRMRLLERARAGFADMMGSGDAELEAESLFAHGLVAKAMRKYNDALLDFDAARALEPAGALLTRIEIARIESLVGAGRTQEALAASARILRAPASIGESREQALFLRSKVLLLVLERGDMAAGKRHRLRVEAAATLEELYVKGPYWKSKVVQMIDAGVEEPLEWAAAAPSPFVKWLIADSLRRRARCEEAQPLYNALIEEGDFEAESMFGVAYCHYHAARYPEAMADLSTYLAKAARDDANYGEAAYLRFKAAEAAGDPSRVEVARAFVEAAPDHRLAYEAWFRLGQDRRDRQLWDACADAFESVRGERGFRLKAMFMGAQCRVEKVLAARKRRTVDAQDVSRAVAACDRFLEESRALAADRPEDARSLMAPLEARAEIMAAALLDQPGTGSHEEQLRRLAGFEKRYPNQTGLMAELHSLRVAAYAATGDLERTGSELERLLEAQASADLSAEPLRKLAVAFIKEAGQRDAVAARKLRRAALRIYEHLLAQAEASTVAPELSGGLRKITEDLRAQTAD